MARILLKILLAWLFGFSVSCIGTTAEGTLNEDGKFIGNIGKDSVKLEKIDVSFEESGTLRYVPRAQLVDLEPGTMDSLTVGDSTGTSNAAFAPQKEEIVIDHDDHKNNYFSEMNMDKLLWILSVLSMISFGTNIYFCLETKRNTTKDKQPGYIDDV